MSLVVLAALLWIADSRPTEVALSEAARYEGAWVRVAGQAHDVHLDADGGWFTLSAAGAKLQVQAPEGPVSGAWVEATGRIARLGGKLTLFADALRQVPVPSAERPSWSDVARDPESWRERIVALDGWVAHGELADRDGHSVRLGVGAWPKEGAISATGTLRFDDGCLCHRFDAAEVRTWTG